MMNPVTRYCTLAAVSRFVSMYAIDYFLPAFFLLSYPSKRTTFSLAKCSITVVFGMLTSLTGGILADKYSKVSNKAYSYICIASSLFGIPSLCLSVLITNNFWLSLFGLSMRYLLSENFKSPNITMLQKASP